MGKRNKVTTRDLAEYTGVSQSTVSMILSKRANVSFSRETIELVEQAAKELGYKKPEPGIKKREKNLAKSIIVICPSFSNGYYTTVLQSINEQAKDYGYTVFTVSTLRNAEQEAAYLKLLLGFELAGIISIYPPEKISAANALAKQVPFVLIGDKPEHCQFDSVELDSKKLGYTVSNYLASLNHTKIAFISAPIHAKDINRVHRLDGLRMGFEAHGISPDQIQVCTPTTSEFRKYSSDNRDYENGYAMTKKLLKSGTDCTAFVGNNDNIAYGIMAAITDSGYRIPHDFSVCGFDNLPLSAMPQISLTTIEHAAKRKGQEAVDIIDRKNQQKKEADNRPYIMRMEYEPELIIRRSTGLCKSN
jgi:LacI family transcriptional regulator